MPCSLQVDAVGVEGHMSAAPRSLHPEGVNATYLDGHVTFLTEDIDEVSMVSVINGQTF